MQFSKYPQNMMQNVTAGLLAGRVLPRRHYLFDGLAFILVAASLTFVSWGVTHMAVPMGELAHDPVSLDPRNLPDYALRTTLRMLIAVTIAFLFTLLYATLAAKSRRAGQIMIPLLDVLQSVPVLGYISFTVAGFIALFPGSTLGVECAAIFAIFTSQAWNMTFSMYHSMQSIPDHLHDAAAMFRLSSWQKFWKLELPFAIPGLIWNMMVSMSGGWFFVVASEAIHVGTQNVALPGIGSYIALAISERNLHAIGYAIGTMVVVILLYDQLLFRPLLAWADKFRYEMSSSKDAPKSWLFTILKRSRIRRWLSAPVQGLRNINLRIRFLRPKITPVATYFPQRILYDYVWYGVLALVGVSAVYYVVSFLQGTITLYDVGHVGWLSLVTLARVVVLIIIASIIWVPLGVFIGMRPRLANIAQPMAQFLSAFPANLLFPIAVMGISAYELNPNIWLSPLMILGTQWYILFNVIAGASSIPSDLHEASQNLHVRGLLWWKKVILPGVFPHYLTGALAASGGAWNASIVAELVSWGDQSYKATGLGAYIAEKTIEGAMEHIVLGVAAMAFTVVVFNKIVWRPLFAWAAKRLRMD